MTILLLLWIVFIVIIFLFIKRKVLDPSSRAAAATAGSGGGVGGDMSEDRGDLLESFSQGSAASYKKLSRFFGEAPPRVENLESLLEDLGYMHLLKVT